MARNKSVPKTTRRKLTLTACDTETVRGRAFLLYTPEHVFRIRSWKDYLSALRVIDSDCVYYNLDYDVQALLRLLPQSVAERLHLGHVVEVPGQCFLEYRRNKILTVRTRERAFRSFDLWSFFQKSLDAVSREYLGGDGKEALPFDIAKLTPRLYQRHKKTVDAYGHRDAALLQRLTDRLLSVIESDGLHVDALYSPGYIARQKLRKEKIKVAALPVAWQPFAESVYNGGRIECAQRGLFENAYIYDLRSAYPWALAATPLIRAGELRDGGYAIACHLEGRTHGLPVRKGSAITYPTVEQTDRWVMAPEAAGHTVKRTVGFYDEPRYPLRPLIRELWERRTDTSLDPMTVQVVKLILNSLYGVLAEQRKRYNPIPDGQALLQSIRASARSRLSLWEKIAAYHCTTGKPHWKCRCDYHALARYGRRMTRGTRDVLLHYDDALYRLKKTPGGFSNRLMAAYCTSMVRARVAAAIDRAGPAWIGSATDSLMTDRAIPGMAHADPGLGDWQGEYKGPLLVVGSGVYERTDKLRFRGFRSRREPGTLAALLAGSPGKATVDVPVTVRTGVWQAISGALEPGAALNEIVASTRRLDLNFDRKRRWHRDVMDGPDLLRSVIRSEALTLPESPAKRLDPPCGRW